MPAYLFYCAFFYSSTRVVTLHLTSGCLAAAIPLRLRDAGGFSAAFKESGQMVLLEPRSRPHLRQSAIIGSTTPVHDGAFSISSSVDICWQDQLNEGRSEERRVGYECS